MENASNVVWSTFVVRLRREGADGAWRGQIVHVQSQHTRYVQQLAQVEQFISEHTLGIDGTPPVAAEGNEQS